MAAIAAIAKKREHFVFPAIVIAISTVVLVECPGYGLMMSGKCVKMRWSPTASLSEYTKYC